jgi:hypothetical protein
MSTTAISPHIARIATPPGSQLIGGSDVEIHQGARRGHVVLAAADDCEPLTRRRSCIQETYPHRAIVRDPTSEFSTRASPR